MNIGFFYGTRIHPPGTGGSVHGYQLARGLAGLGHTLMTWRYDYGGHPDTRHFRTRELPGFLRRVDVMYVRINWEMQAAYRWLCRLRLGRLPVVWEANGLPLELLYEGRTPKQVAGALARLRRMGRRVRAGIGVTSGIARFLREELDVRETVCIPNGSDPRLFYPPEDEAGSENDREARPLEVVWIGTTRWGWHALDEFIRAASILRDRGANVRFSIYGDPDALPVSLPANVRAAGRVPYGELRGHINRADVGVHLFRPFGEHMAEGSPLKLFDYMACGLAVVAQDLGDTGRLIRDREAGVLTTGEPEHLADALESLEADRDRCCGLGLNGRRAVVDYYNWDRAARETDALLRRVVEQ